MPNSKPLTAKLAREFLSYDPETGVFLWVKRPGGKGDTGVRADHVITTGYRRINIFGRSYAAHRVAWLMTYGHWPYLHLDHINRVRDDNRIVNLREATHEQNMANTAARAPGLKGTTLHHGSWRAQVYHRGKTYHLGSYATQEEAHAAYCIGAAYFHGRFANTESFTGPIETETPPQSSFEAALRAVQAAKRTTYPTLKKSVDLPADLKAKLLAMHENFTLTEKS